MCGIQIGVDELENILANRGPGAAGEDTAACGVQVGAEELTRVLANRTAAQAADAACGIQIGAPENAVPKNAAPQG